MTATTARGVKCGNCRAYHPSAEAVRSCYTSGVLDPSKVEAYSHMPASQVNTEATADDINQAALRILGGPASATTQRPASWKTLPDVPSGLYAIESLSGNNDLDFYKINRPTEGKWVGYTFVDMVVGGHPDFSVRGLGKVQTILNRIVEAGIRESAERYGREIGKCCKCNRTLTDDDSRARGIGPECLKNSGW